MAKARGSSEEEDRDLTVLEEEINKLRTAKKELFELTRPVDEVLDRIGKRERECVDKLHHLTTEKHDRQQQQQTIQRLVELESELKQTKSENETLREEIIRLSQQTPARARPETADNELVSELRRQLSDSNKQLNETRQRLSEVQDRLTVAEQVTAATQQRALQQSDSSSDLLHLRLIPDYQPTTNAGQDYVLVYHNHK